eukprot:Gb_36469 [translate_table: standard]
MALLTEWTMVEMVLNLETQRKVHAELDSKVSQDRSIKDKDISKLLYLQDVVKETLRIHPPSLLLSWAHLSTEDVQIGDGMFVVAEGGENVDVRGKDLMLTPFDAGRRVCLEKALGLATAQLWVAKLLHHFQSFVDPQHADLGEVLKLSCEMVHPPHVVPVLRVPY